MAKVCISGQYGQSSADKELMLLSLIDVLRRLDSEMEIVVFSADPEQTREDFDVDAVKSDQWDAVRNELKSADLLISGGGELLKESSDLSDLKYYLRVIKTALRLNVSVFVFNQIIPDFENKRAKAMVARVIKKVRKISVADQSSADVLHGMGIRRGRIHVTEDPLLALGDVEREWRLIQMPIIDPLTPENDDAAENEDIKKESAAKEKVAIEVQIDEEAEKKEAEKINAPIDYDGKDVEIEIRIVSREEKVNEDTAEVPAVDGCDAEAEAPVDEEEVSVEEDQGKEEEKVIAEAPVNPAKKTPTRPHDLGIVAPTFWKKPGEKFAAFAFSPKNDLPVSQITAMADYMIERGYHVVFLPMDYPDDARLGKEIIRMMKNEAYEVDGKMSPRSLYTAIDTVDFVFTSDLYPMILAAVCGKPFASLCCQKRDIEFVNALGLTPTGNMLDYDSEVFIRNFKAAVADPDAVVAAIGENIGGLKEEAAKSEEQLRLIFAQIARMNARNGGKKKSAGIDFSLIVDKVKSFVAGLTKKNQKKSDKNEEETPVEAENVKEAAVDEVKED